MGGSKPYFYHLDAIRFLSALIVMLFHFSYYTPTSPLFVEGIWFGWVGVQVFFVISGFVICESAQFHNPGRFIKSRILRLYPAAIVCAAVSFAILAFAGEASLRRLLHSVLLVPFYPWLTTAYWTLPIEMAFYSVIVVVMTLSKSDRWFRLFAYLLIAYSAAYLAAYSFHLGGLIEFDPLEFGYGMKNLLLLRHGVFFGIGILLFLIRKSAATAPDIVFLSIAAIASACEINARAEEILAVYATRGHSLDVFAAPFVVPFLVLALAVLAMLALSSDISLRPVTKSVLRMAGLATYPLYLIHESFGFIGKRWLELYLRMEHMTALAVASTSAIAAAGLIALGIEPRIRALMLASMDRMERAGGSARWANATRPTGRASDDQAGAPARRRAGPFGR